MVSVRVLSLFDGMSCGQIALERAGITVEKYYASEIDKHAIKVTQANYPDTIQVGDVQRVKGDDYDIDLLLGGSPCQGFSFAGQRLNFNDPRSKLLFDYVRVLRETKPKHFLLENVKMKKEYEDIITAMLRVQPVRINSNLVSAQNRDRLYWTNIPGVTIPEDRGVFLKDIVDFSLPFSNPPHTGKYKSGFPVPITRGKFNCLRANAGCKTQGIAICDPQKKWRKLTPNECEKLQTVPIDYTLPVVDGLIKSPKQRYKMLGNGWTVDVIAHMLSGLIWSS